MRWILSLVCLAGALVVQAQQPFTRNFPLGDADAPVKVNALLQDATGYLWLGTDIGLFRFNGQNFSRISDSVKQPVTSVASKGGDVWVGYANGSIGQVVDDAVRKLRISQGPASPVTVMRVLSRNMLIAGTEDQGVLLIVNNFAVSVNEAKGLSDNFIYSCSLLGSDHLLAATDNGINDVSIAGGQLKVKGYTTKDGLPDNIVSALSHIPGTRLFLLGTQEKGVAIFDAEHGTVNSILPYGEQWPYGQVNDILPVAGYRAWVATESGYLLEVRMNNGIADIRPFFYPGKSLRKLMLGKAGNIWCGTSSGLMMVTAEYLENIKLALPYSLRDVTAMTSDNGTLLVALKKDLYQVSLGDSNAQMERIFSANAPISSLYIDKYNKLWVGTFGDGLYYEQEENTAVRLEGIDEIGDDASILSISGTQDHIWVAALKGVEELTYPVGGKMTMVKHHGKHSGAGSDYVYQLFPDSKENMWMATDGSGVCMYNGSTYFHWNSVFATGGNVAYSITEDKYGDIWAATMNRDLYRFHNGRWVNLRLPETQYPDINISTVMAGAKGQVFSVYQRCIDEWYPQSGYFRHYNSSLGIGLDSTSNTLNCTARDKDDNVYLPYQHGILLFRAHKSLFDIRPAVHIRYPTVYSKMVPGIRRTFAYDENYIGFSFDGINYTNHERLNYRYMLVGYNDDWIYTNDASAIFPRLAPGNYRFRVQVSLNPSFSNASEDSYSFSITAPFWKTKLFYLSVVIFLLFVVYTYIKLRERRLKGIARLQQEKMMFEYEHLKSQVNPHFLFNSLYALSILIEEKRESAADYTVHLADLYRNMLSHSKKDLITLKEELEILGNYVHIQQTRFGESLKVNITVPADIAENRKIVPLAIQLLVENAIKHNIVSATHPLIINIAAANDQVVVSNPVQPKMSQEKGAGIGLVNIKQRYALLTKRQVSYGIQENNFVVQLPLL